MRIFYLELKRVLKSKLTWILLALALLLSVLLAWLPTTYCYSNYIDEDGNEVNLTGLASIAHEKERQADAAGIVTPEHKAKPMIKIRPSFRWILKYPDISHH